MPNFTPEELEGLLWWAGGMALLLVAIWLVFRKR